MDALIGSSPVTTKKGEKQYYCFKKEEFVLLVSRNYQKTTSSWHKRSEIQAVSQKVRNIGRVNNKGHKYRRNFVATNNPFFWTQKAVKSRVCFSKRKNCSIMRAFESKELIKTAKISCNVTNKKHGRAHLVHRQSPQYHYEYQVHLRKGKSWNSRITLGQESPAGSLMQFTVREIASMKECG